MLGLRLVFCCFCLFSPCLCSKGEYPTRSSRMCSVSQRWSAFWWVMSVDISQRLGSAVWVHGWASSSLSLFKASLSTTSSHRPTTSLFTSSHPSLQLAVVSSRSVSPVASSSLLAVPLHLFSTSGSTHVPASSQLASRSLPQLTDPCPDVSLGTEEWHPLAVLSLCCSHPHPHCICISPAAVALQEKAGNDPRRTSRTCSPYRSYGTGVQTVKRRTNPLQGHVHRQEGKVTPSAGLQTQARVFGQSEQTK